MAIACRKYGNSHLFMVAGFFIARKTIEMLPGDIRRMKKMKRWMILLGCLLLSATAATAEIQKIDPIVVTATRTATPLSQIASAVTVVTAEEIEEKQQTQVLDVLRSVPGLTIIQQGSLGGQASIRTRGTDNKHTLILIDGIEFRDASEIGGGADLANLTTDNIERIEVVRGAQSVIYGSDAIGGVVNIITKKGNRQPEGYVSVEGGSYNTWKETAGFSIGGENARAALSVSRTDSDGFSSYNEDDGFSEDDGYKNTTVSFNVGADLSENFTLNLNFRHTDSAYDYDSSGIDSDASVDKDDTLGKVEGILSLLDDKWTIALGTTMTDSNRTSTGTDSFWDNYEFDSTITKFDMLNTIKATDSQTFVIGLESEKEEYESSTSGQGDARTRAVFLQDQIVLGDFVTALGVRVDDHQEFGTETTWRIAPTYSLSSLGTKIKGSIGTGFKAPSLFQLYYPFGGNENLEPEQSTSFDFGIEQPLLDNSVIVAVTWFYNDIDDYIAWFDDGDFDFFDGDGYANIANLKTKGVETSIDWYPTDVVSLQLGYTYTDTEDEDGARKARIPLHKGTLDVNLYPLDNLQLNLNLLYVSEREDGAAAETLDSYTLINLASSYQVTDAVKLFGRIDNLFDEDYEEAANYGTAGLSAYAGVKFSF